MSQGPTLTAFGATGLENYCWGGGLHGPDNTFRIVIVFSDYEFRDCKRLCAGGRIKGNRQPVATVILNGGGIWGRGTWGCDDTHEVSSRGTIVLFHTYLQTKNLTDKYIYIKINKLVCKEQEQIREILV